MKENNARKIIDTTNAIMQGHKKYYLSKDWNEYQNTLSRIIQKAMKKIIYQHNNKSNNYIVYSKSTGYGSVIDWREDITDPNGKNYAFIVTVLPEFQLPIKAKHDDVIRYVENQLTRWAINHIQETTGRKVQLIESEEEGHYDRAQIKLEGKHRRFMVHLCNSKFVSTNAEIIIVD